jgi:hypothetical protein
MQFIRRHWYNLGLALAVVAVVWASLAHLRTAQLILLLNFVALTLHQFEEYGWPAGFPWIMNEVIRPRGGPADRYPLNQNNAFFINVVLAWPFYLIPVFFPDVVWLGLAPTLFGLGQFIAHGIVINRKLKSLYSPGLVAVVLGHVPLGIWYLIEVCSKGMITLWDWVFAAVYIACFIVVGMLTVGFRLLADKESPNPFSPEEMAQFDRPGHLARIRTAETSDRSGRDA